MKSTDIDRIDRELRRSRKKEELLEKRSQKRDGASVGDYIKNLYSLLRHDDKRIYNLSGNPDILRLLAEMRTDLPDKQWENVLRKALRETKIPVPAREEAYAKLSEQLHAPT